MLQAHVLMNTLGQSPVKHLRTSPIFVFNHSQVTPEAVERALRDAVFAAWRKSSSQPAAAPAPSSSSSSVDAAGEPQAAGMEDGLNSSDLDAAVHTMGSAGVGPCEEGWASTLKTTSLVDFFVGYLPLQVRGFYWRVLVPSLGLKTVDHSGLLGLHSAWPSLREKPSPQCCSVAWAHSFAH